MAGTTINTTSSVGIKLTESSQNPVTVTASGTIVTSGNFAIYDATPTAGKITNHGLLSTQSASGTAVEMAAAKSRLTNDGTITGGGSGVYMIGGGAVVANTGIITGMASNGDGVALGAGGKITNGAVAASIAGGNDGILSEAGLVIVTNDGTISGRAANGIKLESGNGTIVNTGAAALISGAQYGVVINAAAHVSNQGTIKGQSGAGIYIGGKGVVANGDSSHTTGLISGASYGVFAGGAGSSVTNFGSIAATATSGIGVSLSQGGTLQNSGTIHGGLHGVLANAGAAKVTNDGTISGGDGFGVRLASSSGKESVINGTGSSAKALIAGNTYGVSLGGSGSVANDGSITAISGAGIYIASIGTVTNGSATELGRLISGGRYGIYEGTGRVTNFGKITAADTSGIGVELRQGGTLQNGASGAAGAAITGGRTGVEVHNGNANITNFGTLTGTGLYGVLIDDNGGTNSLVNKAGALIKGVTGLAFGGTGTLTNAGTITGTGGNALGLTGTGDTLVVDPGAVFNGIVDGGDTSNSLELAAGNGAIAKIGTNFTNFGTVLFDSKANWSLTGTNTASALSNNGAVTLAAGASLDVTSAIAPASTGIFQLSAGSTLEIAADTGAHNAMSFLGKAELIVDTASQFGTNVGTGSYTGPEIENFIAGDMIDLKTVSGTGATFTYSATTGLLQITSGGSAAATLFFETSTLGTGTFHLTADGAGLLVTHS